MHLSSWTVAPSIITVIYFALVWCLPCTRYQAVWSAGDLLHQIFTSPWKIPCLLKLLSNCKIHLLSYDSQFVLQVFLIRITDVDCNCSTATLCQQNRCTYPSSCPIPLVEAVLSQRGLQLSSLLYHRWANYFNFGIRFRREFNDPQWYKLNFYSYSNLVMMMALKYLEYISHLPTLTNRGPDNWFSHFSGPPHWYHFAEVGVQA